LKEENPERHKKVIGGGRQNWDKNEIGLRKKEKMGSLFIKCCKEKLL